MKESELCFFFADNSRWQQLLSAENHKHDLGQRPDLHHTALCAPSTPVEHQQPRYRGNAYNLPSKSTAGLLSEAFHIVVHTPQLSTQHSGLTVLKIMTSIILHGQVNRIACP